MQNIVSVDTVEGFEKLYFHKRNVVPMILVVTIHLVHFHYDDILVEMENFISKERLRRC